MTGKNSVSSNPDVSRGPVVLSVRNVDITYYSGKSKISGHPKSIV